MNRDNFVATCQKPWDVLIIGGGATGLGAAVDAASRGFKTLLLEQNDFAKGTSSRSTKLIHGGLRYLKQGNISLVIEALKERGLLCKNAPHLVSHLPFAIPNYRWWEKPFYGIGIKIYDFLAGKLRLEKSRCFNREETLLRIPTLQTKELRGSIVYSDAQFDDARLAVALAQTCVDHGGIVLNYFPVTQLLKEKGRVIGVKARDAEANKDYTFHAKVVINATGVFSDTIRHMDEPGCDRIIAPSQGVHLVLDRSFMPSDMAIIIPETDDKRVLFFIPWHHHVLVGTTDTPRSSTQLEPRPLEEEVDFILRYAARYLTYAPKRSDILSTFAGLRPLVKVGDAKNTAALSRDHVILVSPSQLITIAGGKWTTYRKMAQDVIDKAIPIGSLPPVRCQTETLPLHGYEDLPHSPQAHLDTWRFYGSDHTQLKQLIAEHPDWGHQLHPRLPYLPVEVIWAVRHEMARTLEDVLARRTRALFLDVGAALEMAPRVAQLMARELRQQQVWIDDQLRHFQDLAHNYLTRV